MRDINDVVSNERFRVAILAASPQREAKNA